MLNSIESRRDPFDPAVRGYHAVYRDNEVNHCPGCGRTHWYLGRLLAECAFCATALPLQEGYRQGSAVTVVGWSSRSSYQELQRGLSPRLLRLGRGGSVYCSHEAFFRVGCRTCSRGGLRTRRGSGAGGFTLVNQTGLNYDHLTIRRVGTQGWKPLGAAPAAGGAEPSISMTRIARSISRRPFRAPARWFGRASIYAM